MKKLAILLTALTMTLTANASSSKINVEFKSPENYHDIYQGDMTSKKKYRKRIFNTLEKAFAENAKRIPRGYSLDVTVLDIDLAGKVDRGSSNAIRKITDHDFPRLHFYVVLKNRKGEIVLQGEQNLKERKSKHNAFRSHGSQKQFYLETMLVDKWFETAFLPAVNKI